MAMGGGALTGTEGDLRQELHDHRKALVIVLAQTLLRLALGAVVIVGVMLLVPETAGASSAVPFIVAIIGSAIYIWIFRRQMNKVYSAKFPTIRAIEALVLSAAMFLALFAMLYVLIADGNEAAFSERLDAFSAYYYALTVLATVGFGDIAPDSVAARSASMVQMALDIVFVAVLIRLVGGVAKKALGDRQGPAGDSRAST